MNCVDLREVAAGRFRIGHDKAHRRGPVDPWLITIETPHGEFYPHSADHIGFSTSTRGAIASRLAKLKWTVVWQDGADGINVIFPAHRFDDVAAIVQPYKSRVRAAA